MAQYITIKEIATKLGISHTTVSRALNDHPRISKATKEKVQQLAEKLGYRRNVSVQVFTRGESKLIGMIVPDLSIHFFARVVQGAQSTLSRHGYGIIIYDTLESLSQEIQAIQSCLDHRVAGILAAISMETTSFDHFLSLSRHDVPLVFYDRVANFLPVPKVVINDHQAAFDATQFLIQSGRKHIAHITASINLNNSNNRLYGYLDALSANNRDADEQLIHYYQLDPSSIDSFIERALLHQPDLDAIFVFNDYVASHTVNVLHRLGKRVPDDIAVMGFSNEPVATQMTPQLSTVKHAGEKMGQLAAQKIVSILAKQEPLVNEKIVISPELIIRETT